MAVTYPGATLYPGLATFPGATADGGAPTLNVTLTASLGPRRHRLGAPVSVVLPRESVELVGPITAYVNGIVTAAFEVAIIASGTRPVAGDWTTPAVVDGLRYLLVGPGTTRPLAVGTYVLWVRHTSTPEVPVLDNAGTVVCT